MTEHECYIKLYGEMNFLKVDHYFSQMKHSLSRDWIKNLC